MKLIEVLAETIHEKHTMRDFTTTELCRLAGVTDGVLIPYHRSLTNLLNTYHDKIATEISMCLQIHSKEIRLQRIRQIIAQYYPFFQIELDLKSHTLFSSIISSLNSESNLKAEGLGKFFYEVLSLENAHFSDLCSEEEIVHRLSEAFVELFSR